MGLTVNLNGKSNGMSLAHKGCSGFAKNTPPDVCKTPSPGGPVPIPYPVILSMISDLSDGTTTVTADGGNMVAVKGSQISKCSGDEAGTAGGVVSSTNMKEAKWLLYSMDVKMEGKNACRLSDKMTMNHGNTVCLAGFTSQPIFVTENDIQCAIKKCDRKDENGHDYNITLTKKGQPMDDDSACKALGSRKHTCVKNTLEKKHKKPKAGARSGACEQTFDMHQTPPRTTRSRRGAAGQLRRPDVVIQTRQRPPRYDVYDAKFPCGDEVMGGKRVRKMVSEPIGGDDFQSRAMSQTGLVPKELDDYEAIANGGTVKTVTPEDCKDAACD
jgi:hypothetical protein